MPCFPLFHINCRIRPAALIVLALTLTSCGQKTTPSETADTATEHAVAPAQVSPPIQPDSQMTPVPPRASAADSSEGEASYQLIELRRYHGDEVPDTLAKIHWLALEAGEYMDKNHSDGPFALRRINLRYSLFHDAIVDGDNDTTGRAVHAMAEREGKVIFCVAGPGLREGTVRRAQSDVPASAWQVGLDAPLHLQLNDRHYRLNLTKPSKRSEPTPVGALWLSELDAPGGKVLRKSKLLTNYYKIEARTIRWAGDLDRDGRLDLFLDTANHYNLSQPTLHLSSMATDSGEAVGRAAFHKSTGC